MDTTRPDLPRILALCGLAVLVLGSYEVVRSAVESMFISAHTAQNEPWAWLAVAVGATVTVAVYNRFAGRVPVTRMLGVCTLLSAGVLVALLGARWLAVPGVYYGLYVWKDVYIVVLVEVFWTFANSVFPIRSARWIYGLFCAAGSVGAALGARASSAWAGAYGTASVLWLAVPILGAVWLGTLVLGRATDAGATPAAAGRPATAFREGLRVLRQSPYLAHMLGLILVIQLVVNLVDYQFKVIVQAEFPDEDTRTMMMARVYEVISYGSLALQLLTGPVLRLIGVTGTLIAVPLIIAGTVVALAVAPRFAVAATAKAAGKILDYSVFRAAKEILYIPLGTAEKTQGKALVDILTYRVAKGGVSLLLKALQGLGAVAGLAWLTAGCVGVWTVLAATIAGRWRRRVAAMEAAEAEGATVVAGGVE